MAECGVVAPNGPVHVARLAQVLNDPGAALPEPVIDLCRMLLEVIAGFNERVRRLDTELRVRIRRDATAQRLMTIPGIGPVCAAAFEALAPPAESFAKGRDFAAWLGLVPRQNSSGGKTRLCFGVE